MIFRKQLEPEHVVLSQRSVTNHPESEFSYKDAWQVVELSQRNNSEKDWFVQQPRHAQLAGEIAAAFDSLKFPALTSQAVQAVAIHDAGWAKLDGTAERPSAPLVSHGRALSFIDVPTPEFLDAWTRSIETAEQASDVAGLMVSGHFSRLGKRALNSHQESRAEQAQIMEFVEREHRRQALLAERLEMDGHQQQHLVDVLQFCDLLSLYICSGAQQPVSFPQVFFKTFEGNDPVLARYEGNRLLLRPSPLAADLRLQIPCIRADRGEFDRRDVSVEVMAS